MRFLLALLLLPFFACRASSPPDRDAGETLSPFAAASGVTRRDAGGGSFRVVPLGKMSGDVEILYGDPEKAGQPFAMRIRELPGTIIPLHSHPVDEHITIVQGTWYFAVGEKWDRSRLQELRVGDYAFAAKGSTMFGYCPDGAVVQVQGVGPFDIHWVHGAKTLDDADAASTFSFKRGERVRTSRGTGTIRNGYASGTIIQYEIAADDGSAFMADQDQTYRVVDSVPTEQPMPVDDVVQGLEGRIVTAFLRKDWNALKALYAKDAVLLPPNGPAVRGNQAIADFFASSPLTLTTFQVKSEELLREPGVVINRGSYVLAFTMPGMTAPASDEGKYLWVLRRSPDGAWRIAIDMFSSNRPAK